MRKKLLFKVCDKEVEIPVDFDTIERIETSFGNNADVIASIRIPNAASVPYSKLAKCVAALLSGRCDLSYSAICDYIVQAADHEISQYMLNVQIACLYLRKKIDDAEFDAYAKGESPKKPETTQTGESSSSPIASSNATTE